MAAQPVLTLEELLADMRQAGPPTSDDVCVAADGTRLDTPEKVMAWIAEVNAAREAARARGERIL